jgi:plasmid maintenance system antidote protein VapI
MHTKISKMLKEKQKTIYFLASRVGGNRGKVYEIVKGFSRASLPMQEKMSKVLGVTREVIFDPNGMARKEK